MSSLEDATDRQLDIYATMILAAKTTSTPETFVEELTAALELYDKDSDEFFNWIGAKAFGEEDWVKFKAEMGWQI